MDKVDWLNRHTQACDDGANKYCFVPLNMSYCVRQHGSCWYCAINGYETFTHSERRAREWVAERLRLDIIPNKMRSLIDLSAAWDITEVCVD